MAEMIENDIKFLAGVGERRALLLQKELGVRTLRDLLYYFPFRYVDRTRFYKISEIDGQQQSHIQIRGRITEKAILGTGPRKRLRIEVSDGSGVAELVWFQGVNWIEKRLETGREYVIFGRPSMFQDTPSFVHPDIEGVAEAMSRPSHGAMQGVYSTSETLSSNHLGSRGIYNLICTLWQMAGSSITETLPPEIIRSEGLMGLREALFNIHFPQSEQLLAAAQLRLKFEELFGIQLYILSQRQQRTVGLRGFVFSRIGDNFNRFYNEMLPFELTGAQKRVIREIRTDTVSGRQMNRLLQGDVGSGKTLVALVSMLIAADNGYQSCLMAPTEILARQHYATILRMTEGLGVRVAVLTGSSRARERRAAVEGLGSGEIDILIGTHALIEDNVRFSNLGFVVIDEQHRFGVEQRSRLWTKSHQTPHILVMSATPIPRTLAMTLYGDLDVSVIDELPPGRKPIRTLHFRDSQRLRVFGFMEQEIAKGRQVYIVYPLIRESEKMDYKDLEEGFDAISAQFPLPQYHTTVVHGRLKADVKEANMQLFKEGVAHIMVATSVIEVGVDVPNASIMVIESAERFGLSQLHQLRGRVGRGAEQSFCILMSGDKLSREARMRLEAMVRTNDGFELAELDLKLRGAGDVAGTQQSGMAFDLKIANLGRDTQIIERAREVAIGILETDPQLALPANALLKILQNRYLASKNRDFSMIS